LEPTEESSHEEVEEVFSEEPTKVQEAGIVQNSEGQQKTELIRQTGKE